MTNRRNNTSGKATTIAQNHGVIANPIEECYDEEHMDKKSTNP